MTSEVNLEDRACSALQNENGDRIIVCDTSEEKAEEEGKFLDVIDNSGARLSAQNSQT